MNAMYLTYPKATAFLRELGIPIAECTLRRMVAERRVPFRKLTNRVVFLASELLECVESRRVEPVARVPR